MAVTATPIFCQKPRLETVQVSVANTNRDATGTLSSAITAGANGSLLDAITFKAAVTSAAGTLRIFYAADGSTYRLLGEVTAAGVTASGTVASEQLVWTPPSGVPMNMDANSTLKFCVNNSETWNVHVQLADY